LFYVFSYDPVDRILLDGVRHYIDGVTVFVKKETSAEFWIKVEGVIESADALARTYNWNVSDIVMEDKKDGSGGIIAIVKQLPSGPMNEPTARFLASDCKIDGFHAEIIRAKIDKSQLCHANQRHACTYGYYCDWEHQQCALDMDCDDQHCVFGHSAELENSRPMWGEPSKYLF